MGDFTFKTECLELSIPNCCVCCLGPAEESIPVEAVHQGMVVETTTTWSFPYCRPCAAHVRGHERAWLLAGIPGLLVTIILGWLGGFPDMPPMEIFGIFAIGGIVLAAARAVIARKGTGMKKECAAEAALVGVMASVITGGTFTFTFRNTEYGKKFAQANRD